MNQFKQILKLYLAISDKSNVKRYSVLLMSIFLAGVLSACKLTSVSSQSTNTGINTATSAAFVGGIKSVKILTNNSTTGSFSTFSSNSTVVPAQTTVPNGYPGAGGLYNPGVSVNQGQVYDTSGNVETMPAWLTDFQLGITSNSYTSQCATFGGPSNAFDSLNDFRVSERDCGAVGTGSGSNVDPIFIRIVLNRSATTIGTSENLLVQIEYQASGIRLNSDGANINPESNVDQLWKVFWNTSLAVTSTPSNFGLFVPPNYASCVSGGSGASGDPLQPGDCPAGANLLTSTHKGAPITVKQFIIPLSAYPNLSVIQISRIKGRITNTDIFTGGSPVNYVTDYCAAHDSPLCLGLIVKSVTLTRI